MMILFTRFDLNPSKSTTNSKVTRSKYETAASIYNPIPLLLYLYSPLYVTV